MSFHDNMRIRHYKNAIQDIDANIKITKDKRKIRILKFIQQEYRRRIKFYKELNKIEIE